MNSNLEQQIGKLYTQSRKPVHRRVRWISEKLSLSIQQVRYYLNRDRHKSKALAYRTKYKAKLGQYYVLSMRIKDFCKGNTILLESVLNKFGAAPRCYLTGELIDYSNPESYQLDHIIPKCKGGDNSLDNLGLLSRQANQSKSNLTPTEFINFCRTVVEYNK